MNIWFTQRTSCIQLQIKQGKAYHRKCGIMAARWQIFRRPIIAEPNMFEVCTKTAIAFYINLKATESSIYCTKFYGWRV